MRFERLENVVYTSLRIISGAMFAMHGAQKILGLFAPMSRPPVGSQLWVGGLIELFGGSLIALGLFTRAVAILAAGTMAVAYFQFHFKLQLARSQWVPLVNKGELAVLYCFVFLFVAVRGPGAASLDARFRRRAR